MVHKLVSIVELCEMMLQWTRGGRYHKEITVDFIVVLGRSSSLFDKQRIQIETEYTSFGHITTQQSQPLNYMTTSPNIWKFPCVYSAPRLEVSLNMHKHVKLEKKKREKRDDLKFAFTFQLTVMSSPPFHSELLLAR